jgi:hypothetical protein
MNALLFDTLCVSRTLRDKGHFTPGQAGTLAESLGEAAHEDLAAKADLAALKADIAELKADIAKLRSRVLAAATHPQNARREWRTGC